MKILKTRKRPAPTLSDEEMGNRLMDRFKHFASHPENRPADMTDEQYRDVKEIVSLFHGIEAQEAHGEEWKSA